MNKELLKLVFNKSELISFLKIFSKYYQTIVFNIVISDGVGKCYLFQCGRNRSNMTMVLLPINFMLIIDNDILKIKNQNFLINLDLVELKDGLSLLRDQITMIIYENKSQIRLSNSTKDKIINVTLPNTITDETRELITKNFEKMLITFNQLKDNIKTTPHIKLDQNTLSSLSKGSDLKIKFRKEKKSEIIITNNSKELISKINYNSLEGDYKIDLSSFTNLSSFFIKRLFEEVKTSKTFFTGLFFISQEKSDNYDYIVCLPLKEKENIIPSILKKQFLHLMFIDKI